MQSGIGELDESLSGGFPLGSSILVTGEPGAGKTIFGMTFLWNGARLYHEKGSYISFLEGKEAMYSSMRALGMDLRRLEEEGMFWYQEMPAAGEKGMGTLLGQAVDVIAKNGVKRVVVDSLSAISQAFGEGHQARQVFHTVIEKLIRSLGCTTLVTSERSADSSSSHFEEFVADGIIGLSLGPPRELEVRKMRGTKINKRRFLCTIDHGFKLPQTRMAASPHRGSWKPIPMVNGLISSGSRDVDRAIGGGFPVGTYAILEVDTDVSLAEVRLFSLGLTMNFLSQRQGVLFVPVGGADAKEIVAHIEPHLPKDGLQFLRVAEELKAEEQRPQVSPIPGYVVLLKGGRNNIDVDTYMLFDTLSELKQLTGRKPVLRVMGYDTMESKYSEVPEKLYNEVGFAIMRTRAAGDLTLGIARPNLSILPKARDMVDWHLRLTKKHGTLLLQGIKPQTPLFAVQCDDSSGCPRAKLVEMS